MSAYDAETGKLNWRWYVVPGDPSKGFENPQMEAAAKTWSGAWWKEGGGGAWDAITYDPQTDLVLIGTGNGAPWADRDPKHRDDNLYISSIVALRLDTGEYAWHYQADPARSLRLRCHAADHDRRPDNPRDEAPRGHAGQ